MKLAKILGLSTALVSFLTALVGLVALGGRITQPTAAAAPCVVVVQVQASPPQTTPLSAGSAAGERGICPAVSSAPASAQREAPADSIRQALEAASR